jgi:flagellar assembly factor FliW
MPEQASCVAPCVESRVESHVESRVESRVESCVKSCVVSPWLGEILWEAACELHFPVGLPGFEQATRIVPVEIPLQRPLIYLQSATDARVCFLTLPVLTVLPSFCLDLSEDDRALLELDRFRSSDESPIPGMDVLCLALLVPSGPTVQTNLDAPIVINLHNGRGVQAIAPAPAAGCYRLSKEGEWRPVC